MHFKNDLTSLATLSIVGLGGDSFALRAEIWGLMDEELVSWNNFCPDPLLFCIRQSTKSEHYMENMDEIPTILIKSKMNVYEKLM